MTDSGAAAALSGYPEGRDNQAASQPVDTSGASSATARSGHARTNVVPLNVPRSPTTATQPTSTTIAAPAAAAKWVGLAGLVALGLSLALTYFGTFVVGLLCLATTVAIIGFLRATLPQTIMAWFASRNRAIDCVFYFGFAIALLLLAIGVPR